MQTPTSPETVAPSAAELVRARSRAWNRAAYFRIVLAALVGFAVPGLARLLRHDPKPVPAQGNPVPRGGAAKPVAESGAPVSPPPAVGGGASEDALSPPKAVEQLLPLQELPGPSTRIWVVGVVAMGTRFNVLLSDGRTLSEADAEPGTKERFTRMSRTWAEVGGKRIWVRPVAFPSLTGVSTPGESRKGSGGAVIGPTAHATLPTPTGVAK